MSTDSKTPKSKTTQSRVSRLGKGISELLGDDSLTMIQATLDKPQEVASTLSQPDSSANSHDSIQSGDRLLEISVSEISPGRMQPRRSFDKARLQELADSIKSQGLVQPLVVRLSSDATKSGAADGYELLAGERRWRAAKMAGLEKVPVIVRPMDDRQALAVGLIENLHREDLNVLEQGLAVARLMEEFQLTQQEVSTCIGKSRSAISNWLRLLHLEPEVKALLAAGDLDAGHARALLRFSGAEQIACAKQVVSEQLSVRQTEQLVNDKSQEMLIKASDNLDLKKASRVNSLDNTLLIKHQNFERRLNAGFQKGISIKANKRNRGEIRISYDSEGKLERLVEQLLTLNLLEKDDS